MGNYNYQKQLQAVWEKAVKAYSEGNENADTYFNAEESAFLESIGVRPCEIKDFAEDYVDGGEPDFATFAMIPHTGSAVAPSRLSAP